MDKSLLDSGYSSTASHVGHPTPFYSFSCSFSPPTNSFPFLSCKCLPFLIYVSFPLCCFPPPSLPFFSSSSPAQGEDCHHEDPPCGVITIPLENPPCCTMYISKLRKSTKWYHFHLILKTPNISVTQRLMPTWHGV